ncbi:MAG: sirohydrochlorin chelatase, partial [Mycobacteriales bacterium]
MTALLLVGHGTRSDEGVAQFRALVALVAARAGGAAVAGGFIELAEPALAAAVAGLAAAGEREVAVVPLVLVAAGHAKGDIPGSLARERDRHPGLRFAYGAPLGPHASLLDALDARAGEVLPTAERSGTAVLLVGRGATDPAANAEVAATARMLAEGRGFAFVETAFVSLAEPGVAAGLERCRRLGAEQVLVLPYFLFAGVLPARVAAQAATWAGAHPGVGVRTASVLGPTAALADLVVQRFREALAGEVKMSCDTCAYRVALPGFEHKVGAPQRPHDHPAEPHPAEPHPAEPPGDLRHHGDAELAPGLVDAAVNVRLAGPPPWLAAQITAT